MCRRQRRVLLQSHRRRWARFARWHFSRPRKNTWLSHPTTTIERGDRNAFVILLRVAHVLLNEFISRWWMRSPLKRTKLNSTKVVRHTALLNLMNAEPVRGKWTEISWEASASIFPFFLLLKVKQRWQVQNFSPRHLDAVDTLVLRLWLSIYIREARRTPTLSSCFAIHRRSLAIKFSLVVAFLFSAAASSHCRSPLFSPFVSSNLSSCFEQRGTGWSFVLPSSSSLSSPFFLPSPLFWSPPHKPDYSSWCARVDSIVNTDEEKMKTRKKERRNERNGFMGNSTTQPLRCVRW